MKSEVGAIRRALKSVFEQREHQHIVEWADAEFWLPPSSSNNKELIRWKTHGFQRLMLHAIADLDTYQVTIKKPTQIGSTKCLLIGIGYESAHRNRSNGVWLPTRSDANRFSNVEIDAMLEYVPAVGDQLVVDFDKKDKDNTTRRRGFYGAQSYCQGTQTLQDVSSVPVEHAFCDEVSKYLLALKAGKDDKGKAPIDGIAGRLDSALDPCLTLMSTCTEDGVCQISAEFARSREQFHRGYFCPCCGEWQLFEWGEVGSKHGFKWTRVEGDDGTRDNLATAKTVYYACGTEDCDHRFYHDDLANLDEQAGEWRSDRLKFDERSFEYFDLQTGEKVESPYSIGIQLRGWHNRRKPWWKGVLDFLDAVDDKQEGRPGKLVDWTQDYLAEAYRGDETADYVRHGYLMSRQNAPLPEKRISDEIQMVTAFWDVQADRIEGLFVGWSVGHECWLLDHEVHWGDPSKGEVLKRIQTATSRVFTRQDGTEVQPFLSGVDAKYLPQVVNSYCTGDWKFKIIPTMGSTSLNKPIVQGRTHASRDYGTFLTTLCPDTAKTQIYSMYKVEVPGPGYVHIPEKACFDEKFIKQMVAEVRKPRGGVYRWVCPEGVRNEGLDMMCGNLAISILAQQRMGFTFVSKAEFAEFGAQSFEDESADDALAAMIGAANA